ncbi:hypothetical protein AKJ16_DCAP21454 [Drosera capensis]
MEEKECPNCWSAMFYFSPYFFEFGVQTFWENPKPKIGTSRLVMCHLSRLFVHIKQVSKNPRSHETRTSSFKEMLLVLLMVHSASETLMTARNSACADPGANMLIGFGGEQTPAVQSQAHRDNGKGVRAALELYDYIPRGTKVYPLFIIRLVTKEAPCWSPL